jgi:hypothetical protein
VAGLWRPLYVEWRNYAINYVKRPIRTARPERLIKIEPTDIVAFSFGISENTLFSNAIGSWPVHLLGRQLAFSSKARCLRVSKTESYGLSMICFEMTRQATMPLVEDVSLPLDERLLSRSFGLFDGDQTHSGPCSGFLMVFCGPVLIRKHSSPMGRGTLAGVHLAIIVAAFCTAYTPEGQNTLNYTT